MFVGARAAFPEEKHLGTIKDSFAAHALVNQKNLTVWCGACLQQDQCTTEVDNNLALAAMDHFTRHEVYWEFTEKICRMRTYMDQTFVNKCLLFRKNRMTSGSFREHTRHDIHMVGLDIAAGMRFLPCSVRTTRLRTRTLTEWWRARLLSPLSSTNNGPREWAAKQRRSRRHMYNAFGAVAWHRTSSTRAGMIGSVRCGRFSEFTRPGTMATMEYLGEDMEVPITSMFDVYSQRVESPVMTVAVETQVWAHVSG